MNTARRSGKRAGSFRAAVVILTLVVPCLAGKAADQWRLIPVEVEGTKDTMVADFALGADGTPWAALARPQNTICYWQEGKWHKIPGEFSFDSYQTQLYVSPAGRVYLRQVAPEGYARRSTPPKPHFGALYLLQDKRAEYVTEYYYDIPHMPAQLFFDSKGRIWNWGNLFLAKFEDGQWERVEANLGPYVQVIEDAQGNVYFFGSTLAYCRNGQLTLNAQPPSFPWEQQQRLKCYLWGRDKAFFLAPSHPGAVVIDLNTFAALDVLHSEPLSQNALRELYAREYRRKERAWENVPVLARSSLWDAFRDREGNVWVLGSSPTYRGFVYVKVCAADNRVEERTETAAIDRGGSMDSRPQPVLCARDGTICFGAKRDGVYLYRQGVLTHMDWKQGLAVNETNWIREHPDGAIWFASRQMGIVVYDPHGVPGPGPTSPFQTSWEEYPLATRMVVRDFQGRLWCCLRDKPEKVSCWNGQAWEHFDWGFDVASLRTLSVDNLQRLHLLATTDRELVVCRLTKGRVDRFRDFQEMLVDSVRTGSRGFKSSDGFPRVVPLVIGDGEIWYNDAFSSKLRRYSGGAWHEFEVDPYGVNIFRHSHDRVLIESGRRFLQFDRGQLVEFTDEHTRNQEYLLGESGLQPFDADLYEAHKGELFPARKVKDAVYVFTRADDLRSFKEDKPPAGAARLPPTPVQIWLAEGGFWAQSDNSAVVQRYYNGLLLEANLVITPVAGSLWGGSVTLCEETSGDLWIRRQETLFHVKRPHLDTRITAPQTAECASRAVRVSFAGTASDGKEERLTYAWRLDGGPWTNTMERRYADVEFERPGIHVFEVAAVGYLGNLDTTPATMKLNAVWFLPEVRIVSGPSEVVTDWDVAIAYEVVKRSEGSTLAFQWRLDGGPWHGTQGTTVRPTGLNDGEHLFEVRAVEDNRYVQEPPASTKFTVRMDYEKVIRAAVKKLYSADYGEREAAVARLVALGARCRPYLKKELESADEDTQWWIRAALGQIDK
jgi:hypothetical protein